VVNVNLDGAAIARVVTSHQEAKERSSDGTGAISAFTSLMGEG